MYIFVVKPIQGGKSSLYFFDELKDLRELHTKHFSRGYSCCAYYVPRSIAGLNLLEDVFGTVPYKITDAFEAATLPLSEYIYELELSQNLIKLVL